MAGSVTAIERFPRHEAARWWWPRIFRRLLANNAQRVSLPLTTGSHRVLGPSGPMLSLLRLSQGSRYTSLVAQ